MTQSKRYLIAVLIILLVAGFMLVSESLRGRITEKDVPPGSIPVYLDDRLVGFFAPADLEGLEQASFVDAEEGKTQEGWLLRDVLPQLLPPWQLKSDTVIVVSSSSRAKSAELVWAEVEDPANWVMFDLSSRGTVKLISTLERLDTRDEWVQDVDRIEVRNP
jgi:hypothetical protein